MDNKTYVFTSSEKTLLNSSIGSTSVPLIYANASLDNALKAMINAKEIKLSIDWGGASTVTVIVTLNSRTNANEFNAIKQVIKSLSDAGYFDVPHNYSKADHVTCSDH